MSRGGAPVELAPVRHALEEAAQARAAAVAEAAQAEAHAELTQARAEARDILEQARADGLQAADRAGAAQLAAARQHARQVVLTARGAAYEALRRAALDALEAQADTPPARRLAELLATLVAARVGAPVAPAAHRVEAVAQAGSRRATLGTAQLVDDALGALADEVAALWS